MNRDLEQQQTHYQNVESSVGGSISAGLMSQSFASMPPDALRAAFDAGQLAPFLRHPSQLYQAFWEGVLMFIVLWWLSSKPRARCVVSGWFAILYGLGRFLLEFVRVPDAHLGYLAFGWLTMGQVLSVPLVLVGVVLVAVGVRRGGRAKGPGPRAQGPEKR